MSDIIKQKVLKQIANGKSVQPAYRKGPAKWEVGDKVVHVRYCSSPKSDGVTYGYNTNPNTLRSDYELWICRDENTYYLIPISEIKRMYDDPEAYTDYMHPQMRVVGMNTSNHLAVYATGGRVTNFSTYYCSIL